MGRANDVGTMTAGKRGKSVATVKLLGGHIAAPSGGRDGAFFHRFVILAAAGGGSPW